MTMTDQTAEAVAVNARVIMARCDNKDCEVCRCIATLLADRERLRLVVEGMCNFLDKAAARNMLSFDCEMLAGVIVQNARAALSTQGEG